MSISRLGEFGLIERIARNIKVDSSVVKGIGDDAAVISFSKDKYLLFCCDMLIEDVDFILKTNPCDIGYRALSSSISDIAAMGGWPRYALVSIGLPENISVNFVDRLYKGISQAARNFKINIVGGDTSRARKIVIDISMLGEVERKCLVLRKGAKIGDYIFVTGRLGMNLAFKGSLRRFVPRIREARFLVKNYRMNSMIDISDGLASDLNHITTASKVGAVIYEDLIPYPKKYSSFADAIYAGEDYELLFTLSYPEAVRLMKSYGLRRSNDKTLADISLIGEIVEKRFGVKIIRRNYRQESFEPKGFRHF